MLQLGSEGRARDRFGPAIALILAVALLFGGNVLRAEGAAQRRCEPKGARTVAADARGRIFTVDRYDGTRWYACLRARDKPKLFDVATAGATEVTVPRIASPYAAASTYQFTSGGRTEELQVIDMRSGRERTTLVAGGVEQLVLSARGVAVFVNAPTEGEIIRVQRLNRDGTEVQLDAGNIAPRSLALAPSGDRVYWIKNGVPQSATL